MDLIERDVPLRELDTAWQAAAGAGSLVLLSGEAGIGKTALIQEFLQRQPDHAPRLWGACDALFTPRPLGPLYDMAPQLDPEFADPLHEGANRPAIFAAFLRALQRQPTLAVVEDIHWADEATLDLLKYVARRVHLTRSLLLLTYRDDELPAQHPLRLLLGDLARLPAVRRIALQPLSTGGVAQLAGDREVDAHAFHHLTGGNPFYLTEALASSLDGIPPTVRDAVLARAARLSLSGRAVLNAAAVAGPRIEPWLLEEMTRAEAPTIDESLETGMLLAHGDVFTFRHELARQVILEAIAPHQRSFLHQAALDALSDSPDSHQDLSRLAHHAEGARNREAILTWAPAAAQTAQASGSPRAAAKLWRLAISYGDDAPPLQRAEFFAGLAAATREKPDRSESIFAQRQAINDAREGGDLLMAGRSLSSLSVMLLMEGETEAAVEAVEAALAYLERQGPTDALAIAHKTRAFLHLVSGENHAAEARARSCLNIARRLESTSLHIHAFHALGICSLPLNHRQGCDYLEESLALVLEENAYWAAGSVYADLTMTYVDVYRLRRASELTAAGLRMTADHDLDLSWRVLRAWQSILLLYRGAWTEAEEFAAEILEQSGDLSVYRVPALVSLGRLRARRGLSGAQRALDEALQSTLKVNNAQRLGVVYTARAEAAWLRGDHHTVQRETDDFYHVALDNRQPGFAAELAYWRWHVGQPVETFDWMVRPFVLEIEGNWREAAAEWERLGCPYEQARALAHGDTEAQKAALVTFEELGAQPMAEWTRRQLRDAGVQTIPRGPRSDTRQNPFALTNRQLQVLGLLVEELTNAEIAERLHISPKTVDHHVSAVLARLDVSSREEAAELARRRQDI
ncbi:MAG: ATP-binding protein [Chloroflexota bacterium]